jgi:redox-sensitive bicupin YhaK (pirin superfamily)
MTAGRGIVHAEVSPREFMDKGGPLEILQLWVNLPPQLKMTEPRYTGLQRDDIPAVEVDDGRVTVNVMSGTFNEVTGPFESLTGVFMTTIEMQPGARLVLDGLTGRSVFLYVVRGMLEIGADKVSAMHLAELNEEGDMLELASADGALLLFGHAEAINAPVVSHGPFVMNTREEIIEAINDYQAGKFGAPRS